MKIKLGHKLAIGFFAVVACGTMVNSYDIRSVNKVGRLQDEIVEDQFVSVSTLLKAKSDLIMSRRDLLECIVDQQIEKIPFDVKEVEDSLQATLNTLEIYTTSISNEEEQKRYNEIQIVLDKYMVEIRDAIDLLKNGQEVDGGKLAALERACNELLAHIDASIELNNKALETAAAEAKYITKRVRMVTIIGGILCIATGIIVAVGISLNIVMNTRRVLAILNKAAEGDLTESIEVRTTDELGEIAEASNALIASLTQVTKDIMGVGSEVAASSEELLSSAEETNASVDQVNISIANLANGTSNQVKAIQEIDENITNVAKGIEEVADNAMYVDASAKKMVELANEGLMQSQSASRSIVQIREVTDKTAEVVSQLGVKSDQIGKFVEVIKALANQTNLLALNAAIEAARAGEQGKGFAVVADEVKVLAEESATSAEEIAKLVSEIQAEMAMVIETMAVGTKEVHAGVEVVETASKSFVSIADEIEEVVKQIEEVNAATGYLKQNANNVVQNMRMINEVAEESSASTEEISASAEEQKHSMNAIVQASEELANLAGNLQVEISRFKIR